MKKFNYLLMASAIVAIAACNKENVEEIEYIPAGTPVVLKMGEIRVDGEEIGKMAHEYKGGRNYFNWEVEDAIRIFANDAVNGGSTNIVDLGEYDCTDEAYVDSDSGEKIPAQFAGLLPDVSKCADAKGDVHLFCIYPDNPSLAIQQGGKSVSNGYEIGMYLDDVQCGDAFKHCYLASNDGIFNINSYEITKLPIFKLSTPVLRFNLNSSKDIKSITVEPENIKNWLGKGAFRTTSGVSMLMTGDKTLLTLKHDDNTPLAAAGVETEISFTVRSGEPLAGKTLANTKFTFTFYASDGTSSVKVFKPGKQAGANTTYKLGSISVSNFE